MTARGTSRVISDIFKEKFRRKSSGAQMLQTPNLNLNNSANEDSVSGSSGNPDDSKSPEKSTSPRGGQNNKVSNSNPIERKRGIVKFGPDGYPVKRTKEVMVFFIGGRMTAFPLIGEETIGQILVKLCRMWPSLSLNPESGCTSLTGEPLDLSDTISDSQADQIVFSTTYEEWKKEYVHNFAAPSSTPSSFNLGKNFGSHMASPRVDVVKVFLPQGQQRSVFKDKSKTLNQVLKQISTNRNLDMEGKIPQDAQGNPVDVELRLSDIKVDEIYWGCSKDNWNSDTTASSDNTEESSPRTLSEKLKALDLNFLVALLPNNVTSKQIWNAEKTLADTVTNVLLTRGLTMETVYFKDEEGNRIDPSKTLGELGVHWVSIILRSDESKPVLVYLPHGQTKTMTYDPQKKISELVTLILEAQPMLQQKGFRACDVTTGNPLDPNGMVADLEPRAILFGTTMKEWNEVQKAKAATASSKQPKSPHVAQVVRKKRGSSTGKPPSSKKKGVDDAEELKKMLESKLFRVYLPGGDSTVFEFQPDRELEQVLERICQSKKLDAAKMKDPFDLDGNVLDRKKKLGELGVMEISYGITMKQWTIARGQETIKDFLKNEEGDGSNDKIFKVYLPNGHISSHRYAQIAEKSVSDVLDIICTKRSDLQVNQFVPTNFSGIPLDLNTLICNLPSREFCFGTDMLEWVMLKHQTKKALQQNQSSSTTTSSSERNSENKIEMYNTKTPQDMMKMRLHFIEEWQNSKKSSNDSLKESGAGTYRAKKLTFGTPKSKASKNLAKNSFKGGMMVDYENTINSIWNSRFNETRYDEDLIIQNTSYFHIQHSYWDDDQLLDYYLLEEERGYKSTSMVPFRFLEGKSKSDSKSEISKLESAKQGSKSNIEETLSSHDFSESSSSSDEMKKWMESMEQKANDKREELQSISVTYVNQS
eukprot:TRINITY_DN456_c3_g1_i1.p1 TRINITY_DN456_c3_g1~~TRINITY_DN456_c3_g1_i1.p1  ORF type:complete len:1069 (-),score=327.30 TRINITY_DN456_c3_g1_i1:436-3228(-)